MSGHHFGFEADLDPESRSPRMRFNFANGWSASIALRSRVGRNGCDFMMASVAAAPTGHWGEGQTEILETECCSDEAIAMIAEVAMRPQREGASCPLR